MLVLDGPKWPRWFACVIGILSCIQISAQTLQFSFPFDDGPGASTTSAAGAAGPITLTTVNNAGVPVDLHGGPFSGPAGSQSIDFSIVCAAQQGTPSALAYVTNCANLGLGAVSNCTVVLWFQLAANNLNTSSRLFILGTNGITDNAAAGYSSIGIQLNTASTLQVAMGTSGGTSGYNVTFSPLVNGQIPVSRWQFIALVYDTLISNGVFSLYTGDVTTPPRLVATNILVGKGPLNLGTSGTLYLGNRLNFGRGFSGKLANLQFYTGTANFGFISNVWAQTAPYPAIVLPPVAGASPGSEAVLAVTVPPSVTATGSYHVTLTSDNVGVIANTNVTVPQYITTWYVSLPVLGQGVAHVTASGAGLGGTTARVVGLNESGLVNRWCADDYITGQNWTDSVSQAVAVLNSASLATAVPNIFGMHAGVIESNYSYTAYGNASPYGNGFLVPAGTAFGGTNANAISNWTVAVVFKPIARGASGGTYYDSSPIIGWDLPGFGAADWGLAWGYNNGACAGIEVVGGVGLATGSDSSVGQTAGNTRSGVEFVHCAVMQVNADKNRLVLCVDGEQVAVNYISAVWPINTTNDFGILESIYQRSLNGYVGEIRLYTNALVDPVALSSMLLYEYGGTQSAVTITNLTYAYVDPPGQVVLRVQVPDYASAFAPFTLGVTSSTPSVVELATSIVFPRGVTSTNITVSVIGSGFTVITGSGEGVISGSCQIGGLYPRTIRESFQAANISGLTDGESVNEWYGVNGTPAYAGANAPIFVANATPAGTPSVKFTKQLQQTMAILSANDPLAGTTNYSVVAVFRANDVGAAAGGNWWDMAGIADHELPGTTYDWGLELDGAGRPAWGTGLPNHTLVASSGIVDPLFHVIVATYDFLNGVKTLAVDDQPTIVVTNLVSSFALPGTTTLGANKYGSYLSGEIARLDFYSGALSASERSNVINSLRSTYNLVWPSEALIRLTANPISGQVGEASILTVGIPEGYNNSITVTVAVSSASSDIVAVGGTAVTNIVFPKGGSNIQTLIAQFVSPGSTVVSASGPSPLIGAEVRLTTFAVPTVREIFRASSLTTQIPGIGEGDAVPSWTGDVRYTLASASGVAPVFHANATPAGLPSVRFPVSSNAFLSIDPAVDPTDGLTNFSVAVVFKADAPSSNTSPNWWDMAGLLDNEEVGTPPDWGLEIDSNGQVVFGTGSANGQVTATGYDTVGSGLHVVVASYDSVNGIAKIQVDDQPPVIQTNLIGLPRIAGTRPLNIGANQWGTYFAGEIAECRIYDGALNPSQAVNLIAQLKTNYSLIFPGDFGAYTLRVSKVADQIIQLLWPVAATVDGWVLESTTNLSTGWSLSSLPVSVIGTNSVVTDSITNRACYYRLRRP